VTKCRTAQVLPMLLVCFSDLSPAVREATDLVARSIMSSLSAQGTSLLS
jgi:hypothetical protein